MLVTGRTNISELNSLSIQYMLDGLSFYESEERTFIGQSGNYRELCKMLAPLLRKDDEHSHVELLVYTNKFISIPEELFDSSTIGDYLFTKNIVCAANETVQYSLENGIVTIFLVDSKLIEWFKINSIEVIFKHALQRMISLEIKSIDKIKRARISFTLCKEMLCYVVVCDKKIIAFDCVADCDYNRLYTYFSLFKKEFKPSKICFLQDENDNIKSVIDRCFAKTTIVYYDDFFRRE